MSDIALARACCAIPLYISLIALAFCSRHARPLAPASPPPATHSLCREQFCRLALLYCMRVGCLLCCCLFIRQSPAGLPPSASAPSSAPNSDNCWSLLHCDTERYGDSFLTLEVSSRHHPSQILTSSQHNFSSHLVQGHIFRNCRWPCVANQSTVRRVLASGLEEWSAPFNITGYNMCM